MMHVIDMAYGLGMKSLCLKGDSRLIGAILLVHPGGITIAIFLAQNAYNSSENRNQAWNCLYIGFFRWHTMFELSN
jgi:hypothetical protein